jgi:predicted secreted protein
MAVNHRAQRTILACSGLLIGILWATASPVAAANELTDGIAPGIVRTTDGFGSDTVVVPANGYVTYLVRGGLNLAGTPVQVWINTTGRWVLASSRSFAADGTLHYFSRVAGRTSIQARIPGTPSGAAGGQVATTWGTAGDQRTRITLGCSTFVSDDFARPDAGSSVLVQRVVGVKAGTRLDVVLCSNAFLGYAWAAPAVNSAHFRLLSHRYVNDSDFVGAPGTETWSFLVMGHGAGHAFMAYNQVKTGGQKAVWSFILTAIS